MHLFTADVSSDVAYHLDGTRSGEIVYTTAPLDPATIEVVATDATTGESSSFTLTVRETGR